MGRTEGPRTGPPAADLVGGPSRGCYSGSGRGAAPRSEQELEKVTARSGGPGSTSRCGGPLPALLGTRSGRLGAAPRPLSAPEGRMRAGTPEPAKFSYVQPLGQRYWRSSPGRPCLSSACFSAATRPSFPNCHFPALPGPPLLLVLMLFLHIRFSSPSALTMKRFRSEVTSNDPQLQFIVTKSHLPYLRRNKTH